MKKLFLVSILLLTACDMSPNVGRAPNYGKAKQWFGEAVGVVDRDQHDAIGIEIYTFEDRGHRCYLAAYRTEPSLYCLP